MTYFSTWEDFAKAAERLYSTHPDRCRIITKYLPTKGAVGSGDAATKEEPKVVIKMTDDFVCLQYVTAQTQDMRKLDKLNSNLMRAMVSKEHGHGGSHHHR